MQPSQLIFHDSRLCQCDIEQCSCPCHVCQGHRDKIFELNRLSDLAEKLRSMGIDPRDLSKLMISHLKQDLELFAYEAAAVLARCKIHEFISEHDFKEKLAELLFDAMLEVALGVQHGVNANGRVTNGTSGAHRR